MKKTISINIAGLIFYIEEDGYDKLKNYLNAIQKYFSTYEDSKEIISDIESRIAEKFMSKQKLADTQVISLEDVDNLIQSMGTVSDFEAIEEEEDLATRATAHATSSFTKTPPYTNAYTPPTDTTLPKKLYRDTRRKLLGGVCAGIAHYFNTDPLLVRLIFLFIFIGLPASGGILNLEAIFAPFSGLIFLVYIACWVAFPGSDTLEEDKNIKKFYRDPDQKVVGGVAAGVAAYFGIDLGVVRFLWVLSIFLFGTGLMLYFILWAITPRANTLTEKMEMTGQPITLENIETNVKKALQPDQREETALTKLLLFPFRAIAAIFNGLTPLAKFSAVILRIFAGIILVIIGGSSVIALLTSFFAFLGIGSWDLGDIDNDFSPFYFLAQEVSPAAYFFLFLAIGVPFAVLAWAGISLLSRQNRFTPAIWQTMLGLFLVGMIGSVVFGTRYAGNFRKEAHVEKVQTFAMPTIFDVNEQPDGSYNNTSLAIEGYDSNELKLEQRFGAQGRSREDAEANANAIKYNVVQIDSALIFDANFEVDKNKVRFRGQRLSMTMYVPYNKPFSMTRDFYDEFWGVRNKIEKDYNLDINDEEFKQVRWAMKKDSGLVCLNRPLEEEHNDNEEDNTTYGDENDGNFDNDINTSLGANFEESLNKRGEYVKEYTTQPFQRITVAGAFAVRIQKGDKFKIEADGRQKDIDRLTVSVENGKLIVKQNYQVNLLGDDDNDERVGITITMPYIESLNLAGATVSKVDGFNALNSLDIDVAGASKAWINVRAEKIDLNVAGASKIDLVGSTQKLDADLVGACSVDATQMNIKTADISAAGASKVTVGNIPNLRSNMSGFSKINRE